MLAQDLLREYKVNNNIKSMIKRERNKFYRKVFKECYLSPNDIEIGTDYFKIILPYDIIPASRPQVTKFGTHIAEPYKSFKEYLKQVFIDNIACPIMIEHFKSSSNRAYKLSMDSVYKIPDGKSMIGMSRLLGTYKICKPDTDNLEKTVGDALEQAGIILNDSNIALVHKSKTWGLSYSTEIKLEVIQ